MHEFAEKKKEEKKLVEELVKKHPSLARHHASTMSEGPMLIDETKGVESRARQQYEKDLKLEISEIRKWQKLVRRIKRGRALKARKGRTLGKKD